MKTYEQRVHDLNKSDIYNYDALYRLKDITFNADDPISPTTFDKKKDIQFDKIDNILKLITNKGGETSEITTQVNNLNQYIQFDQWGLAYDLNGNTSQKGTQFFTYDYRNQLISVIGEGSGVTFKYDVLGRRIEKEVNKLQVTSSRKYFYAGNQVIEERDISDQVLKQYIYGNGIDEILRVDKYESGNPIPYYFHTNSSGSITAITDNTGNLIERYTYDIYGMPTIKDANDQIVNNSVIDNEYLFHARRYDPETNLYYYRARYYDPIMGRFLSTDPMGYKDSMNLYQAFNMNGVNFVDPFGELIYLNGENPELDFVYIKQAFTKMGVKNIADKLLMKKDAEGRYYLDLAQGKETLISNTSDRANLQPSFIKWVNTYTKDLKNMPVIFNRSLESIFEFMILDRTKTPIDFRIGKKVHFKDRVLWFDSNTYVCRFGGGVTVEPFETENEHVQIVVDPNKYSRSLGGHLNLDVPTIIVHEFGHALANMLGYFGSKKLTKLDILGITKKNDPLFTELAIMFENLFRLKRNQNWLRGWHNIYGSEMKAE